jgi:hypothetical protein
MVGNLHGQLLDLLELFLISTLLPAYRSVIDVVLTHQLNTPKRVATLKRHSTLPATRWGHYGAETVTQLLALKAAYPDRVHLLRGKHETRPITQVYGLYDDCARKYRLGVTVWTALMHVFDRLPLAAVVDDKVVCVSSGLSPELQTLTQIDDIDWFVLLRFSLFFVFRSSFSFFC